MPYDNLSFDPGLKIGQYRIAQPATPRERRRPRLAINRCGQRPMTEYINSKKLTGIPPGRGSINRSSPP